MFNREENIKDEIILMTLSEIVPKDHFLKLQMNILNCLQHRCIHFLSWRK